MFLAQQGSTVWGLSPEPSGIQQQSKVVQCLLWLGPASDCSKLFVAPLCSQSSSLRLHNSPKKGHVSDFLLSTCLSWPSSARWIQDTKCQHPDPWPVSLLCHLTDRTQRLQRSPRRSTVFSASLRAHSVPLEVGYAAQSQEFPMANPAPKTVSFCALKHSISPLCCNFFICKIGIMTFC